MDDVTWCFSAAEQRECVQGRQDDAGDGKPVNQYVVWWNVEWFTHFCCAQTQHKCTTTSEAHTIIAVDLGSSFYTPIPCLLFQENQVIRGAEIELRRQLDAHAQVSTPTLARIVCPLLQSCTCIKRRASIWCIMYLYMYIAHTLVALFYRMFCGTVSFILLRQLLNKRSFYRNYRRISRAKNRR